MMSTISRGVDPKWDALQDLLQVVTDASATRNRIQQMADAIAGMVKAKSELDAAKDAHAEREAAINQRTEEQNQRERELQQREAIAAQKSAAANAALATLDERNTYLQALGNKIAQTEARKKEEWKVGDDALAARTAALGKLEAKLNDALDHATAREATAAATVADYNARVQRLLKAAQ